MMKKLLTILLTFVMMFSFVGMTASAEETGTIIINNTGNGTTYRIYKILDLAGYDNTQKAYRYTLLGDVAGAPDWYDFFKTGEGSAYVEIDSANNVTANSSFKESTASGFAKLALEYAKTNRLAAVRTETGNGGTLTFTGLDLGYYLVDSSMGALCGLTTTKPTGSISVKNSVPTIEMTVQEDSNVGTGTNEWGKNNSVDIGQTINYDVSINAQAGAENYVFSDVFPEQFTFVDSEITTSDSTYTFDGVKDGIIVKHHNPSLGTTILLKAGVDYTVANSVRQEGGGELKIIFTKAFCDSIKANDKIYVTYSAKLLGNATIGGAGNVNECVLKFGDLDSGNPIHESNRDQTTTYTYGVDIVKTDSNGNMLEGAEFQVYTTPTGGEPIQFANVAGSGVYRKYVVKAENENIVNTIQVLKIDGNTIARVKGLDNGTYYLAETKTPNGYNPLTARREFYISGQNHLASFENESARIGYIVGSGIHIENKTGTTMPETGGMGTTLFVSLGAIVVLGTGVLLVTKKRMSMIDD